MAGSTTLISAVSAGSALRDTQVDEYYSDISSAVLAAALRTLAKNPYPGLRPFKTSESIVFFGREGISSELTTRLAQCRFLAVLGASGTGKSSLIRAGLLPVLETLPGQHGSWKIAICRPGKNPFGNLARAIFAANIVPAKSELDIWQVISGSSYGFEKLYDSIDNSAFNTLIIIDQFEEIFRYRNDYGVSGRNDAALFVKMLIETSQNVRLNTYVMITMRSEYLGDCVQLPQLVDAINNGQYLVPRLKPKQIADTIIEPTRFSNATLEPGYASKLIGEIGDGMDQLPVLQHVLMRAYERAVQESSGKNKVLVRYEDYVSVGRMDTALDKHAREVYDSLTPKQQEYCKILFQSITDKSTDGRGIRRPLPFSVIFQICKEKEARNRSDDQIRNDLEVVINSFRKDNINFLMPPPHVPLSDELEIDISHESLMRIWNDLQRWIEEESGDANLLYELLQRDKKDYIRGGKLMIYKEWLKRKKPGLSWAFLYKPSELTNDGYRQKFVDAINLVEKSRQKQTLRRITVIGITSIIFLSLAANYIFSTKYSESLEARNRLLDSTATITTAHNKKLDSVNFEIKAKNKNLESANSKITTQKNELEDQKKVLIIQQVDLKNQKKELFGKNKDLVAKNNLISTQAGILLRENNEKQSALNSLRLTKDSLRTVSEFTNLKNIALESLSIPVYDLKREDIKAYLALVAYQLYLNSGQKDKSLQAQSQVYSALYFALRNKINNDFLNKDIWQATPYQFGSDHLAYGVIANDKDNRPTIFLTAEDTKLYSFDMQNKMANDPVNLILVNKLVGIQASSTGWIALNTLGNKLLLSNYQNNLKYISYTLPGTIRTFKFSPDGSMLYVYTQDQAFTTINLATKDTLHQKIPFKLEDIAISNTHIYGLTSGGEIIIWNKNNNTLSGPVIIPSENKSVSGRGTVISCKPDNSLVIWGNENGQVFYLENENSKKVQYLTRFSGPVTSIAFNNSFSWVAVASYDKTIQVFNLPTLKSEVPLNLNNNEGPVTSLFVQNDKAGKENLVALMSPGIIRVYPMDLETLACKLYELYKDKQPTADDLNTYIDKSVEINKVEIKCK